MKRLPVRLLGRSGMVLFVTLAILGALALIGSTMFVTTSTDVRITRFHRESSTAFNGADAGVYYTLSRIATDLSSGSLRFNGNANLTVNYAMPAGVAAKPVTNLYLVKGGTNPVYAFIVEGVFSNARSRVEAAVQRRSKFAAGVFGDGLVDTKAYGSMYSYDARVIGDPVPSNSEGEADIGSNGGVTTHTGTYIDGDVLLGADGLDPADRNDPGDGSIISGIDGMNVGEVDADPLGLFTPGGEYQQKLTAAAVSNNNASITNSRIHLVGGPDSSVTLNSGVYYFSELTLGGAGKTLTVNNVGGPVTIYLTGAASFANGSQVNILGSPADFSIISNSSQDIDLKNSSSLKGLVYAPRADVLINNSANFYGLVWADTVQVNNGGAFWVDQSITDAYLSNRPRLVSWKELP